MSTTHAYHIIRLACFYFFYWIGSAQAQQTVDQLKPLLSVPKTYVIYKADGAITIDGKPDEQVWKNAAWTDEFIDIEGAAKPQPLYTTRTKMLWDEQFLYIYAQLEEPHVWGTLDQHDAIVFQDNDFEVFIKNEPFSSPYYEVEINALGTVFDLYMPTTYRVGGSALTTWDVNGLQQAVYVSGTLNDPTDTDQYWAVEMAIPFSAILHFGQRRTASSNDTWRINFSRVQWQHELVDGRYQRKRGPNGRPLPESNWVWSPQGVINMHYPERWGYVRFDDRAPDPSYPVTFEIPHNEAVKQKAWLIFYLQRIYRQQHDRYTADQKALSRFYQEWDDISQDYNIGLSAGNDWFVAKVHSKKDSVCFSINQHGDIRPAMPEE